MIIVGAKLGGWEDVIVMDVTKDTFGDDFFEEFSTTFKKGDRAVSFWEAVVRFGRFGNDDHKSVRPGVMTQGDCGVKEIKESIRLGLKSPFYQLVIDAGEAWSRFVRGGGEGFANLMLGDGGEVARGKGIRVVVLEGIDFRMVDDKEALLEGFRHFIEVFQDPIGGDEEWRNPLNRAALAPSRCFPEVIGGGMVKEIVGPFALRSGDGATERLDSVLFGLA